jgi:hypothetical protein
MKDNLFTVQEQVVIIRRYKDIGITSQLHAFHLPTAKVLLPRYYKGSIAWQYKNLRVGVNHFARATMLPHYTYCASSAYTFLTTIYLTVIVQHQPFARLRARLPCCDTRKMMVVKCCRYKQ